MTPEAAALAGLTQAVALHTRSLDTNNERLAALEGVVEQLVAALAPREGPSPLEDVLARLVAAVEELAVQAQAQAGEIAALRRAVEQLGVPA